MRLYTAMNASGTGLAFGKKKQNLEKNTREVELPV